MADAENDPPTGKAAPGTVNRARRLLLFGGVGAGALAVFGSASLLLRSNEDLIVSVIRRHLPDQGLPDTLIRTFAAELLAVHKRIGRHGKALIGLRIAGPLAFWEPAKSLLPAGPANRLDLFERKVLTLFLFSTDFFEQGAKGWEQVTYQGLYDPYLRPCGHPLSGIDAAV